MSFWLLTYIGLDHKAPDYFPAYDSPMIIAICYNQSIILYMYSMSCTMLYYDVRYYHITRSHSTSLVLYFY